MMRWIIVSSLQFRLLVLACVAVLMIFGVRQLRELPVDVLPEFSRPHVEIQTEALGLSAAEVESLITTPLEADMLNGVSWVDEILSESIPGLSSIVLIFEQGTDVLAARQMVQERLVSVHALPNVSKPPAMLNPTSSASRCLKIGLTSETHSLIDMSVMARWTIKPRLMGVPGVANVSIWGQRKRQLQVQVDPEQLREKGVTLSQIIDTTGNSLWVSPLSFLNASTPGTGGFIDTPNQRLGIRHLLPISTPDELAEVTVVGTQMRLGDVANVVEDHQPLIGDALVDDSSALMLVVEKFPWANTRQVTQGVEEALDAMQPGLAGLRMDPTLFRPATFVETAMSNIGYSLSIGGVLLVVVLLLCLYNWRSAVTGVVGIATSMLAAVMVLYLIGAEFNMMILTGLLIGLCVVIDDVIVDTQNIVRRLRQHRRQTGSEDSLAWVVREASMEMRGVCFFAMVITLLAVVPVLAMEGVSAAFLQPLAFSFALAVLISMLVALAVTPVLCVMLWRNAPLDGEESAFSGLVTSAYDTIFAQHINKTGPAFAAMGALLLVGLFITPQLRQESLLPAFKETELLVELDGPSGTSHPAMNRITNQATQELRQIPGVKNVSALVGRAEMSDEIADVNASRLWVTLDPSADHDATLAAVRRVTDGYPGVEREISSFLAERVGDELKGQEDGIVVRVYGDDMDLLRDKALEVQSLMAKVSGVIDPIADLPDVKPTLEIEVDLERAKAHGVKPGDVRRAATALLSGIECGSLFEHQKVFEVVVWGKPEIRHSVNSIEDLLIDTPSGGHVKLDEVADITIVPLATNIQREAVARYIDVHGQISGRDLASVAKDVERGLSQVEFPLEYRAEMLGAPAERLAVQQQTRNLALASAVMIFLLFQAVCGSWRLAALMFVMLPIAIVGGLLAIFANGGLLSIGSIAGLVAIVCITARHASLLVRRYQQLTADPSVNQVESEVAQFRALFDEGSLLNGSATDGGAHDKVSDISPAVVLLGTRERIVPIAISTVAMAVIFVPLAIFGNIAGLEIAFPMAVAILGGLVTSTLVCVFVFPSLYLWLKAKPAADIVTAPDTIGAPEAVEQESEATTGAEPVVSS